MPEIPYPPELSLERQIVWIRAHMLFPDSPPTALSFFARNLVGSELKDLEPDDEVSLPIGWIRALAFGKGVDELVTIGNQRERAGITAGLVLVLIFAMAVGKYDRPSLNKAAHIIEEIARRKKKQNERVDHCSDRKEIFASWKLMKNSAHFWAAYEWIFGPYGSGVLARVQHGDEAQRELLRVACSFRQFGCGFCPSNTQTPKPLLDSDGSLRLPDDFESLAYPVPNIQTPQWIIDSLKDYRAPQQI